MSTNNYRELSIGCGSRREKDRRLPSASLIRRPKGAVWSDQCDADYEFQDLATLDINPDHKPDILFNLERIDGGLHNRIPGRNVSYAIDGKVTYLNTADKATFEASLCPDSHYTEIHAYEVLEHIGQQGDYRKFFDQFSEFWRILKPGGFLFATVPSWHSEWAWGDPSHRRIITPGSLAFLSQQQYREQVGVTPMSDFRWYYKADFETVYVKDEQGTFGFVLQAVK